ncbi:MAG TPA: hypothetical protein VIK01_16745 [Polyangiaceae bacterium]
MAQKRTRLFPSCASWGTLKNVSDLRDPDRDPDHLLAPERLIELENGAEPARQQLRELPAAALEVVQAWLSAELAVARERALEVADFEFAECVCELEQRLRFPGSFMRDAQASLRIQTVLGARAQFRVIQGGG